LFCEEQRAFVAKKRAFCSDKRESKPWKRACRRNKRAFLRRKRAFYTNKRAFSPGKRAFYFFASLARPFWQIENSGFYSALVWLAILFGFYGAGLIGIGGGGGLEGDCWGLQNLMKRRCGLAEHSGVNSGEVV
jgi:hypothetical protein